MSKKIQFVHREGFTLTPCPHGGAVSRITDEMWTRAKVGSQACSDCIYNNGTFHNYVICKRKDVTNGI